MKYVSLNLFSLVPKRGASVGDIGKGNASNPLVRHRAHEQKLVATPGIPEKCNFHKSSVSGNPSNKLHIQPAPCGGQMNGLLGVVAGVGVHPAKHPWQMVHLRQRREGGYEVIVGRQAGEEEKDRGHTDRDDCNKQP